ncbi:hypothetical protein DVS77_30795 [Mycolicibacterium moriokaense]|nr:hypothetical protein DVS77_30795 [Mycolicibacterium moriokaense]
MGAGAVAASLLIVGPNPAQAVADKHGSGPFLNDDNDRRGPSISGGFSNRGGPNWVRDVFDAGDSDTDPPVMELGAGSSASNGLAVADSVAPQGQAALRTASIAEAPTSDNLAAAAQAGDNVAAATPRAGSAYAGQPVSAFRAPRVVIGNGRTPGEHPRGQRRASESVQWESAQLTPPAEVPPAPAAIEIDVPPFPPPVPPIERMRPAAFVLGELGTSTIDTVPDPLAGLAGLILIPAVGAVLGYRQAKAAQSLRESLRR